MYKYFPFYVLCNKRTGVYFLLVVVGFYVSSCAAILTKREKVVAVTSSVEGTYIYVNGALECQTPCTLTLKPKYCEAFAIEAKKEGYHTKQKTIESKLGVGWLILDIVLTTFLGPAIDGISGAWLRLDTQALNIQLIPEEEDKAADSSD